MSGIYGSGSSGGGGIFGGSTPAPAPAHHGLLHDVVHAPASFTGHLLGDVRDAAVGLPQGLIMAVEHPINAGKVLAKTTWHDWSPLFHGHFSEWGHNFMAHPLAPILDVAGFVTLGAGTAARGGEALATLGAISKESKLAQLSGRFSEAAASSHFASTGEHIDSTLQKVHRVDGKPVYAQQFDANPVARLRQHAVHNLGSHLAEVAPNWFGRTKETIEGPRGLPSERTIQVTGAKVRDFSPEGRADRHFKKQESYRAGATRAMIHAQLGAFVKAGKDIATNPGEVFRSIEQHGQEQLSSHAYRVAPEQAAKLGPEYTFVKNEAQVEYVPGHKVTTVEDFQHHMANFATRHTTPDLKDAAVDDHGNVLVVHKRASQAWEKEAKDSATFLTKLYRYPTKAWKYLVLATRPAYFVNNAVGNTFMAMATLGPVHFTRGLVDAYRQVHGERAAVRDMTAAEKALRGLHGDWQDKHYLGVHQGFGQEAMSTLNLNEQIPGHGKIAHVAKVAEQGFYPITHKVADVFLRRVMVNALLRKHGAVQDLMSKGVGFNRAADFVSRDPLVRDKVQEQVNNALGDYHHLNTAERHVRNLVPFYTWDRAIARHGIHLALDKSGRTAVAAHVGQAGTADTEQALGGNIPDFLKGLVVLNGHGKDGRSRVLTTQGLNPYASIPDVADTVGALVGVGKHGAGETIASQANPLITGAIEAATGQSLLSGAKLPHRPGGLVGQIAANTFEGTPAIKLVETLIHGEAQPKPNARTGKTKPFLYRKDARAQIAAFLGVPVKELDTSAASALADKQHGVRRGRKRRSSGIYG